MIINGFELAAEAAFALLKTVYESTDAFAADFEQEYSTVAALGSRLEEVRARPGSLFLVARDRDEMLGFTFIVPRPATKLRHTADLTMGMCQGARGRGLGSKLLRASLSRLRNERLIEIVYLMVRTDNLPALRLYEACGFEKLATLTRDTKIGTQYHDGMLMRLQLSSTVE